MNSRLNFRNVFTFPMLMPVRVILPEIFDDYTCLVFFNFQYDLTSIKVMFEILHIVILALKKSCLKMLNCSTW